MRTQYCANTDRNHYCRSFITLALFTDCSEEERINKAGAIGGTLYDIIIVRPTDLVGRRVRGEISPEAAEPCDHIIWWVERFWLTMTDN